MERGRIVASYRRRCVFQQLHGYRRPRRDRGQYPKHSWNHSGCWWWFYLHDEPDDQCECDCGSCGVFNAVWNERYLHSFGNCARRYCGCGVWYRCNWHITDAQPYVRCDHGRKQCDCSRDQFRHRHDGGPDDSRKHHGRNCRDRCQFRWCCHCCNDNGKHCFR